MCDAGVLDVSLLNVVLCCVKSLDEFVEGFADNYAFLRLYYEDVHR